MHSSCTMMSPSDISLVEDEGVERDGVEQEGGATESVSRDLNCASLCLTIVASMAHMIEKWAEERKGIEKWHKMLKKRKQKLSTRLCDRVVVRE